MDALNLIIIKVVFLQLSHTLQSLVSRDHHRNQSTKGTTAEKARGVPIRAGPTTQRLGCRGIRCAAEATTHLCERKEIR